MDVRCAWAIVLSLVGLTVPARAQTVISINMGLAHDCFVYAKAEANPQQGIDVCNQSLKIEMLNIRDRAATYDNRGVMLDALGRTDSAAQDFNMSIKLDPQLGDPYVNLGSMQIKQKQYQDALDNINKGLSLRMDFPHIGYYDRAVAEEMLGRYKESYYDYKKVLELEPSFSQAAERLKDFVVVRLPAKKSG